VLVSTSVAEEGLDVPEVDLVLFYEPVPTAIRSIQRKGRTGRQTEGNVAVLLAEDTRDEAYFWKARQDEKQMESELRLLKDVAGDIESHLQTQAGIDEFPADTGGDGDGPDQETGEESAEADTQSDTAETPSGPASGGDGAQENGDGGEATDEQTTAEGQAGLGAFANTDGESTGGKSTGETPTESDGSVTDATAEDTPDEGVVAEAGTDEDDVEIVVDQRELDSAIARDLSTREGVQTRLETLEVGDYVLSDRVVVERKTVEDFLSTLLGGDRSMFEQVGDASRHYGRPVVIIEGSDLYGRRNVHPNAIHGALASLAVDFGVSIMQTDGEDETRDLLATIAAREQEDQDREVSVHGEKQSKTLAEQQEYVVASIAEVGPVTARSLLGEFGSVEDVMTADTEDLKAAEGVGEVTAERIREVVTSSYDGQ
jgi:ERCC4-type nuclease